MSNITSEATRAPQTSARCQFFKPVAPESVRYTLFQRMMRKMLGDRYYMAPRPDGNGGFIGFRFDCEREMKNLVLTGGKNDLLDKYFGGSGYTAAWYAGLVSSVSFSAYAAGDTMASHAGWTEAGASNAPNYTGNRPAITFGAASGGVKASSSIPTVTFSATGTVKGLFTTTVTTKDGTTGILYSAGNFTSGDAPVGNGYVMTLTFSATQT